MTSESLRRGRGRGRGWAGVLVAATLAGCAAAPTGGEREYLDEQTAATVTVGAQALVFAHDRPDLGVHARDYLTLVPVDVNRSGVHEQYFVGYAWSTLDKRSLAGETAQAARFELIADGRRIPLEQHPGPLRELGFGAPPLTPPARSATLLVAPASREQQDFVLSAADVRAVLVRDQGSARYDLWRR